MFIPHTDEEEEASTHRAKAARRIVEEGHFSFCA